VTTVFQQTPLMATYLVGFVVSDYEFISNEASKEPGDVLHRIAVSRRKNVLIKSRGFG
jgi:aminopeptidase N